MEYKKDGITHKSIKEFNLDDGTIICVFAGSRGAFPDRDIIIKYKENGKRLRTPKHIHWVIDLLIKKENNPELTTRFMRYLREIVSDKRNAYK